MKIEVTQKHIQDGIRLDTCNCPIALAICDAMNIKRVAVCEDWIDWGTNRIDIHGSLYMKLRAFISGFDRGIPVSPFLFELEEISCQN